jgi:polyketide synthase PksL
LPLTTKLDSKADDTVLKGRAPNKPTTKTSSEALERLYTNKDLTKLAQLWTAGERVDWDKLYDGAKPQRIGLLTYPFAKTRHWVGDDLPTPMLKNGLKKELKKGLKKELKKGLKKELNDVAKVIAKPAGLHPLVSHNSSTLSAVSFSSVLSDDAFYAVDHQVNGEKIFPGAGFLEIACLSGTIAGEQKVCKIKDIVWAAPLSLQHGPQTAQIFLKTIGDGTEYQVTA